jgi:hypothetical protein
MSEEEVAIMTEGTTIPGGHYLEFARSDPPAT